MKKRDEQLSFQLPKAEANFTAVPNYFFENLLPDITNMSALKCYLHLMRKTWGWNKQGDWLTLSQIAEGTGLCTKSSYTGMKWLEDNGLIWSIKGGPRGREEKLYFLKSEETEGFEKLVKGGGLDFLQVKSMIRFESDRTKYKKSVQRGSFL